MEDNNDGERPETESPSQTSELDLEARLNVTPTLDTDIMDFLVIAGLRKYAHYTTAYNDTSQDVRERIGRTTIEKYESRRATLSRSEMISETRFVNRLTNLYHEGNKSLRDLKTHIETYGLQIPGMGCASLAYFNSVLEEYGLEHIKLGGKRIYPKVLAKYGLEPTES